MFKVLLVEDEIPVRDRIVKLIDWNSLDLSMVYVANDGQEAYEYLETYDVDLILTDICMPFMDGIELAKKIRAKNDLCKIIFLTGYDNFQYAKDAIELDVYRYLQKPVNKSELENVLKGVVEELNNEIKKEREFFQLKNEYEKQLASFQDRLILDTLHSRNQYNNPKEAFEKLNIDISGDNYRVAVLQIVQEIDIQDAYSMLTYSVFSYFKNKMDKDFSHRCILGNQSRIILILSENKSYALEDDVFLLINKIMNSARHIFSVSFSAGISSLYSNINDIKFAFNEAISACQYSVVEGYDKLILSTDMEAIAPMYLDRLENLRYEISNCIRTQDSSVVGEKLKFYFDTIRFCKCSIDEVKSQLLLLVMAIYKVYNNSVNNVDQKIEVDYSLMQDIFMLSDIREIEQRIVDLMIYMTKTLRRMRESFKSSVVEEALDIIHSRYMISNLDSKQISTALNVSASYFSKLFKQITQKTFVEYLTECRMTEAKKLLRTSDMKVYEISVKVGYDDPQYFSYNFRKHVGTTPSSYRKKGI
jgi:two-component system response regulator YesN